MSYDRSALLRTLRKAFDGWTVTVDEQDRPRLSRAGEVFIIVEEEAYQALTDEVRAMVGRTLAEGRKSWTLGDLEGLSGQGET